MGDSLQYIDIVLLAMVAGFVALRLRSVLGRRTGDEEARAEKRRSAATEARTAKPAEDNVSAGRDDFADAPAPGWVNDIDPDSELGKTLSRIMVADRKFDPAQFVEGARSAYGMIVQAYAEGDRETLQSLLSPEIYEDFEGAIAEREAAGQTMETTLIDIEESHIVDASLEGDTAEITLRFDTLAASAVRDAEGNLVSGNIADAEHITDLWTFARVLGSSDPNWLLVDTSREE